jgi:hypothetical protein
MNILHEVIEGSLGLDVPLPIIDAFGEGRGLAKWYITIRHNDFLSAGHHAPPLLLNIIFCKQAIG